MFPSLPRLYQGHNGLGDTNCSSNVRAALPSFQSAANLIHVLVANRCLRVLHPLRAMLNALPSLNRIADILLCRTNVDMPRIDASLVVAGMAREFVGGQRNTRQPKSRAWRKNHLFVGVPVEHPSIVPVHLPNPNPALMRLSTMEFLGKALCYWSRLWPHWKTVLSHPRDCSVAGAGE